MAVEEIKHCCEDMKYHLTPRCDQHNSIYDCPDVVIAKIGIDFGLPIHDGGCSYIKISHCPWCGSKLNR